MKDKDKLLWEQYYKDKSDKNRNSLVLVYSDLCYKIANEYAFNFNKDVEDVYQYCILGLIQAIKYYCSAKKVEFTTFAWVVIRNTLYKEYSKEDKYQSKFTKNTVSFENLLEEGDMDIEEVGIENEDIDKIDFIDWLQKLPKLNKKDKKVILLKFLYDYNNKSLSEVLGKSEKYYDNLWSKKLKPYLKRRLKSDKS